MAEKLTRMFPKPAVVVTAADIAINKTVPRLNFAVKRKHRKFSTPQGPIGRIDIIRKVITQLLKYERIEVGLPLCNEARGYAERLLCEAIRNGDKHPPTMDMADFWLYDKQMVHKLFKVLAPRYQNYKTGVTDVHMIPMDCKLAMGMHKFTEMCVLELKGNPFPPMPHKPRPNSASLTNILLKEASKEYRKMKLNSEPTNKQN